MGNSCKGLKKNSTRIFGACCLGGLCVYWFNSKPQSEDEISKSESLIDTNQQDYHAIDVKPESPHAKKAAPKVQVIDPTEHPLHEIDHIVEDLINQGIDKICILISTGSLNPVHLGHVKAFVSAKETLESEYGLTVAGAFMSPSDASWCSHKKHGCFSNEFRLELAQLAVADIPGVFADPWECSQLSAYDFPDVCRDLIKKVNARYGPGKVQVIYLCGADHATKCGLWRGGKSYGVCVMARPGYDSRKPGDGVFVCNVNEFNASSTEVRAAIANNDLESVRKIVHPNVFAKLLETDELLN